MKTIYFDNGATTMPDPIVLERMRQIDLSFYANASSIHHAGVDANKILEESRKIIADSIDSKPDEIIFTSGGTESNNLAIKGFAFANRSSKNHIITTKVEHDCILNSCKWLSTQGFEITYLDVDEQGFVNPNDLKNAIKNTTFLVSIIHANNEIGTIQNLGLLYKICNEKSVTFHTDACQSYTKTALSSKFADMITINSHKIHGPKGIGALYVKKSVRLQTQMHGGGHERGLRSGTQNVCAIVGFAKAVQLASSKSHIAKMKEQRDYFISKVLKIEGTKLNGPIGDNRLCNNINISFKSIEGESLLAMLDLDGICTSTGSACASKSLDASHVIMAISNNDSERAHGSIRFTLSRFNTYEEIDFTMQKLEEAVKKLRKISPISSF